MLLAGIYGEVAELLGKVQLIPAGHTVLGRHVVDIHEAVELLLKRGILFERYPGLPQDERGMRDHS